ncbi:MAG: ribonuclease activity regulator RraA [Alphaproteobacteria bacterium]|jgi:regulator of RNase E activity RraA|nr:ribonuclease activity regulator RraA [Alphaproteobacteria bacterium]
MNDVPAPPAAEVLAALAGISTATVSTQLFKRGYRNVFVRGAVPLNTDAAHFAAPAFTLRYIPAREDVAVPDVWSDREYPQRKAIETMPEGWVLVVDARGDTGSGGAGDILVQRLKVRGVAGFVTDGAMRDTAVISEMAFPVFCAGAAAPASAVSHFAADAQVPIGCGGVAVFPGDILVGDGDGIVVVPRALAEEVAHDGVEQERFERFVQSQVECGRSTFGLYPPGEAALADYAKWDEE